MKQVYLWAAIFAASAPQLDRRACDHAAPPPGTHYVCLPADSCNCHLERDEPEDDQGDHLARESEVACASSGLQYFEAPSYPEEARRAQKQGIVQAQVLVGPSGIRGVKIESGDPLFTGPVTETLKRWRFSPADRERLYAVSVRFLLAGDPSADCASQVSGTSPLDLIITAHPPPALLR